MSFTKVAPAGIGTSPGTSILIGDSLLHSTGIDIGSNTGIGVTIRKHGDATFTGIITASAFFGDGSGLEGVSSSGIGTPLSDDDTSDLNKVYYVNQELSIGSTVTVNHPSSAVASYTHYQDLVVKNDADFIVADGDTFIPDILGITTSTLAASAATGGRIRAGTITNAGANGAVNFPNGLTGTAGTFTGNLNVGGVLTYEDVTNVDSVGVITARSGIDAASNLLLKTGGTERLRIDSTGALGLGITPKNNSGNYRQLQIGLGAHFYGRTDDTPIYLVSNGYRDGSDWKYTANTTATQIAMGTRIVFSSAASGTAGNTISFSERLRIGESGQIGIAGANYGTSGQVLTSQGSGSAVQWATPAAGWVHGTETALNGNVTLIKNGVPDGASHIRYLFRYVSTNSSAQPYVQVEYNNNGTIKNSNYQTCSTMVRGQGGISGDSDKTDGLQLWYSYTNPGNILHGVLDIYRIGTNGSDGTNMYMSFHGMGNSSSTGYDATFSAQGYFEIGTGSTDYVSGIKISTQNGSVQFDNGYIQQSYLLS